MEIKVFKQKKLIEREIEPNCQEECKFEVIIKEENRKINFSWWSKWFSAKN